MMEASWPLNWSRKRRVVADEKRKKALFSCDRCKTRKIACKRPNGKSEECLACTKSSNKCTTTIERKRRSNRPIENISLHYKCLLSLVRGAFPHIDANNIDSLIEFGKSLEIEMPSRDGKTSEKELNELSELSNILTSSRAEKRPKLQEVSDFEMASSNVAEPIASMSTQLQSRHFMNGIITQDKLPVDLGYNLKSIHLKPFILPEIDLNEFSLQYEISLQCDIPSPGIFDMVNDTKNDGLIKTHPLMQQPDSIIVDQGGNIHYIGPYGAPGFLQTAVNLIGLNGGFRLVSNYQKLFKSEIIISSSNEPLSGSDLKDLQNVEFPVVDYLDKTETDFYVDLFFEKIHERFFCFVEGDFRRNYELFWFCLRNKVSWKKHLTSHQICCFYLVWILSAMYDTCSSQINSKLTDTLITQYIQVIKLCLSDVLLTPTLDGIRCCILLSIFMDNNKKREIAYILLELASRQAISLGINRESVMTCTTEIDKVEAMKRTWWTLFTLEINYSIQMGRSSCMNIEDITIEYPSLFEDLGTEFQSSFSCSSELSKCSYEILEYRKKLSLDRDLLSISNILKAESLTRVFDEWFANLPAHLSDLGSDVKASTIYLHLRYFYYTLSFTFPFLIYASNNMDLCLQNACCRELIDKSIHSSVRIGELLNLSNDSGSFNGSIFPDLFIGYHAIMALIVGYTLLKGNETLLNSGSISVNLYDIKRSVNSIRNVNNSNKDSIRGSSAKISRFIDIFCNGFDIMEEHNCRYKKSEANETNDNSHTINYNEVHNQISRMMEGIPMFDVPMTEMKDSPLPLDEEYSILNLFSN